MDFAERAARNEEVFRNVNEGIEAGAEQHHVSGSLPFHCECGGSGCMETIEILPARYAAIVRERYHFVVLPGHEERVSNGLLRPKTTFSSSRRLEKRGSR